MAKSKDILEQIKEEAARLTRERIKKGLPVDKAWREKLIRELWAEE